MEIKNKKILITGADGFIGSHLVEEVLEQGGKVKAFVYYNSFNSFGWLDTFQSDVLQKIEVVSGDIRDKGFVQESMQGCDMVFHLAALIGIPYSYHAPDSYVDTNIKGTLNVLSAAQKLSLERVLVTSTSEVYGTAQYIPINEKHPYQGQSPYSATKIGADRLAESFFTSFDLPVTIVRPFNTFGPRQSARAIIPSIITQILSGSQELHLGNLTPTRDLNYVKDVVKAFVEISKCNETIGEEINICNGKEISMRELVDVIVESLKADVFISIEDERLRPSKSEVDRLLGDNSKILSMTNWKPQISLSEGLMNTIEWLKKPENLSKYKALNYNI
jgi:NAD dependent epimerase/dehydratase